MEEPVKFECGNIRLAGRVRDNTSGRAVVVTHPHPLYGGNMDNIVVLTMVKAFFQAGFTTLRFNFRGTGSSTGMFDNGPGEQEDVRAAVAFLRKRGAKEVWLAGYSFGAWVNSRALSSGFRASRHIMVSPPMGLISFNNIVLSSSTALILTGQKDEIAPQDLIREKIDQWNLDTRFEVLSGCDHFYSNGLDLLRERLVNYLEQDGS